MGYGYIYGFILNGRNLMAYFHGNKIIHMIKKPINFSYSCLFSKI